MGTNIHALAHRLTALSMAFLASAALTLCVLAGFGCSFVEIRALERESVGASNGADFEDLDTAYLGVRCLSESDAAFYPAGDNSDRLWDVSRIFLYTGLSFGAATTLFAWLLGTCVRPTAPRWRILSVLAACSAVFQIPIFLVFEGDNCNFDVFRQSCKLGIGAYLNVVSISVWIVMTIWVQCLRAPRWDEELDAWRVNRNGNGNHRASSSCASSGGEAPAVQTVNNTANTNASEAASSPHHALEAPWAPPGCHSRAHRYGRGGDLGGCDDGANDEESQRPLGGGPSRPLHESPSHRRAEASTATSGTGRFRADTSGATSEAVHAAKHSTEAQTRDGNASGSPPRSRRRPSPGFHVSCVYADGTQQDAHFPSVANCCLGMGVPTEEDEATNFKTFRDDFRVIEYTESADDNPPANQSESPDYLFRKLQTEEKAAIARRAERDRVPVEYVTSGVGNRGGSHYHHHTPGGGIATDDVSEMTRGSGWASGVSEILDDTDLRHQPRVVLEELRQHY